MRGFLEAYAIPDKTVWVVDRFDGRNVAAEGGAPAFPPDLNTVRAGFARFDLLDDRVVFLQGTPSGVLGDARLGEISLLRVDGLEPGEVEAVLEAVYDRVAPGGFVVIDDYGAAKCQEAVDRFRAGARLAGPLERVDWSAAFWPKEDGDRVTGRPAAVSSAPAAKATKDLSVVVVVHDMLREARRTLHSLSRSYQEGIDDLDYEVIVVENGSAPEQRLGEEPRGELRSGVPIHRFGRGSGSLAGTSREPRHRGRDWPRDRRDDRRRAHAHAGRAPPRDAGALDIRARRRDREAVVPRAPVSSPRPWPTDTTVTRRIAS